MSPDLRIAALVSAGRHPVTGRPRRADTDARAVELGLGLVGPALELIHAGPADPAALRPYLGMGPPELRVLEQAVDADAVPALVAALSARPPDLVLAGMQAEIGEASGLLPYLLAERLGWPLVAGVAAIDALADGRVELLQARPRGQRRALSVELPAILTADPAAAAPRQSAYGPARRGRLRVEPAVAEADPERAAWTPAPARPRPKRTRVIEASSAAERMRAATAKPTGAGGRVIRDGTARDKAQRLLDRLIEEGVVQR